MEEIRSLALSYLDTIEVISDEELARELSLFHEQERFSTPVASGIPDAPGPCTGVCCG